MYFYYYVHVHFNQRERERERERERTNAHSNIPSIKDNILSISFNLKVPKNQNVVVFFYNFHVWIVPLSINLQKTGLAWQGEFTIISQKTKNKKKLKTKKKPGVHCRVIHLL